MRNKTEVQVTKRQIRKVCLQRWLPITNLWKLLWSVASTVIFLPGVAVLYVAVLARRASPRLLAYAVLVLMLCGLSWLLIVDFRFATRRAITSVYRWCSTSGISSTRSSRSERGTAILLR